MKPVTGVPETLPRKPRRGDCFDLTIERLGPRGAGLVEHQVRIGPQEDPRRLVFEVPGALPGDEVRVVVRKIRKGNILTYIDELIAPSPQRIEGRCKHFRKPGREPESCGGCSLQSLSYLDQLSHKGEMVRRLVLSAGVSADCVQEPIAMNDPWYYRNKMELSFGTDASGTLGLGMHPPGRRYDVLHLEECFLLSKDASELAQEVAAWVVEQQLVPFVRMDRPGFLRTLTIREGKRTGERMLELTTTGDELASMGGQEVSAEMVVQSFLDRIMAAGVDKGWSISSVYWTQHIAKEGVRTRMEHTLLTGSEFLREEIHMEGLKPLSFEIHPRAFFQPNTTQAEVIYTHVATLSGLQKTKGGRVLDLFCGTGTIGLALAQYATSVVGIELQEDAVASARLNAANNEVSNIVFHAGDVAKVLRAQGLDQAGSADLVVVDPPRAGLTPAALEVLLEIAAPKMVYVSCNPRALARDLVVLHKGGWKTTLVQPIDQFPHTMHIETLAVLERS
jgi:23S rRNA (uracil1939-C5)-methyltransferase